MNCLPSRKPIFIASAVQERAGQCGTAISLLESWEHSELQRIEALLQQPIEQKEAPDADTVAAAEQAFRDKMEQEPEAKGQKIAVLHEQILKLQNCRWQKSKNPSGGYCGHYLRHSRCGGRRYRRDSYSGLDQHRRNIKRQGPFGVARIADQAH